MQRAVRQLGTRDMATIIERYQSRSFGFASKNFYCEFLAALEVEENAERYFGRLGRERAGQPRDRGARRATTARPRWRRPSASRSTALRGANLALVDGVWSGQRLIPRRLCAARPEEPAAGRRPTSCWPRSRAPERHVEQVREARVPRAARRHAVAHRRALRRPHQGPDGRERDPQREPHPRRPGARDPGPHARGGGGARARRPSRPRRPRPTRAPSRPAAATASARATRSAGSRSATASPSARSPRENGIRNMSLVKVGQVLRDPAAAARRASGDDATRDPAASTPCGAATPSTASRAATASTPKLDRGAQRPRSAHRIKAGQRLVLPKN